MVTLLFQYYCQCVKCSFEHFINCSAYSCGQQNWVCSFNRKQHWLPVTFRITFKLACLTYKLLTTGQPAYLHMLLLHYTTTGTMWLTNQFFLDVPRFSTEFGKRSFRYLAPTVWNGQHLKGEFNLDIMSQSGYWSYISVNNFHPLVIAFCTLVKKLWDF